jgi:hypothetical protein
MKIELIVDLDTDRKDVIRISSNSPPDARRDIKVLLEAASCIANIIMLEQQVSKEKIITEITAYLNKSIGDLQSRQLVEKIEA